MKKEELKAKFELMEEMGADNFHVSFEGVLENSNYTFVQSFYNDTNPAHKVLAELEWYLEECGYEDVIEKLEEIKSETVGDD
ncbi:hypothetical protein EHX26_00295 [Brochothrix thermosphacta]|uniref:hypothetical protein n=1 Tax=Brochothrix thermosphacta TaxID=2756 RepID=UPI00083F9784|nr:hypothetical protein [Brochothrix thermosphacta]MPQ27553.1 hypothetical protein [Brochothrix thermosphacta]ODJ54329.1 hypothetical protein BFR42_07500 [Brochothrix thermosphacta]ODJ55824.1 hypothetical protein BFR38_07535 [Brochothrix thermosphacta]